MPSPHPLPVSLFTRSAARRALLVIAALIGLWLSVLWAVAIA
jgi:hypothetical protein